MKGVPGWALSFDGAALSATTSGAVLPALGGTLGVTGGLTITAAAFPRTVTVGFSGLCVALAGGSVDFTLRRDGVGLRYARVAAVNLSGTGSHSEHPRRHLGHLPAGRYDHPNPCFVYLHAALSN